MGLGQDCRRYADDLSGFVDKTLPERRLLQVSQHLIRCSQCSAQVEDLRRVRDRLGSCGGAADAPSSLTQRLSQIAGAECDQPLYLRGGERCTLPTRSQDLSRRIMTGSVLASVALVTVLVISLALAKDPAVVAEPVKLAREQYSRSLAAINVNQGVGAVLWAREQGVEPGKATQLTPHTVPEAVVVPLEQGEALSLLAEGNLDATYSGTQRVWLMDGDGVHRPSDVEINQIAGEGSTLTVLDAESHPYLTWFVPALGCCSQAVDTGWQFYSYTVTDSVAGRTADVLEARDISDIVVARWWMDTENGVILHTERYNTMGYPTLVAGYISIRFGAAQLAANSTPVGNMQDTSAVSSEGWCIGFDECPLELAGLPLVALSSSGDSDPASQRLVYSDGVRTLSVTWTEGVLAGAERITDESPGQPLVSAWQAGDGVVMVAATSGSRALLAEACDELPGEQAHEYGLWERVGSGLGRIIGNR